MWSFGCLLYELYTGDPLFPGESEEELLQCIMEVKGIPPDSIFEKARRANLFYKGKEPILNANSSGLIRQPGSKTLNDLMECDDELFVDFVNKCLEWDTADRLTPESALGHKWIQEGLREITETT